MLGVVDAQAFLFVVDSEVNAGASWHGSLPYFIFMAFIAVIAIFSFRYLPETKGKSLEEIESIWR
ncbi:hypothetical protein BST95_05520 [Halioglobus japonicus]|uniref:D-xylose-proton symporter n=1 Tax=Halioglobus japonicus TaxID=930805 RepID=A0AAP8SML9_9GAMM|nr:MFS transporter [Halioglobus japonicus]AQA17772.1 hypothetical protein BST95_05520 [Halioglobus japonicus]PLW85725.1 hypothetical protein C0029_14070 [Halioglobus japonicus]GHD17179.1 hypothetical protein GCM10007052_23390 [Halioglobus japonicus]